jgi:hypothetical protein
VVVVVEVVAAMVVGTDSTPLSFLWAKNNASPPEMSVTARSVHCSRPRRNIGFMLGVRVDA